MQTSSTNLEEQEAIRKAVRDSYGQASQGAGCCGPATSCCGGAAASPSGKLALSLGYDETELLSLPEGANMGLSCGNPTAIAALQPGEVVLDLGSGGGFDVFIAGRKVGNTGRVIGVDMTPEMLAKARRNTAKYQERTGLDNVEFRLGEIEHLPVADNSIDVVLSNCVINLSPDKPQVWSEITRVLKPGGRVAVSDMVLLQPLPETVNSMVEALVGCIAGASLRSDLEKMMAEAGLDNIHLEAKHVYTDAMSGIDEFDPMRKTIMAELPNDAQLHDYITSMNIQASKPRIDH